MLPCKQVVDHSLHTGSFYSAYCHMFPITNQGYASGLHWANTVTKTLPYTCIICNVTGLWSLSGASAQFRGSSGWANKPCRENHDKSVKQCLYRDGEMFQLFKI